MSKITYPQLKNKFYRLSYTEAMIVARQLSGGLNPQYFYYMRSYEQKRQKRLEKEMVFNEVILPEPRLSARLRRKNDLAPVVIPESMTQQRLAL